MTGVTAALSLSTFSFSVRPMSMHTVEWWKGGAMFLCCDRCNIAAQWPSAASVPFMNASQGNILIVYDVWISVTMLGENTPVMFTCIFV